MGFIGKMSKHDKWHFILSFLGNIAVFCGLFFFIIPLIPNFDNPALMVLLPIVVSAMILWTIHWIHEEIQARQPLIDIKKKYGSWEKFLIDTRQDWKLFWYGLWISIIINGLIGGFYLMSKGALL